VAIEKLNLSKPVETTFASGGSTNDSLGLPGHYSIPQISLFCEEWSFQQRRARPVVGAKPKGTCGGSSLEAQAKIPVE
jgi:hypothetical protein